MSTLKKVVTVQFIASNNKCPDSPEKNKLGALRGHLGKLWQSDHLTLDFSST